jgi:alpha-tubulin suppressor-like RCC1 family protein
LACGDHHTAVLTTDGVCITWGANSHGQLGTGVAPHARPSVVADLAKVINYVIIVVVVGVVVGI